MSAVIDVNQSGLRSEWYFSSKTPDRAALDKICDYWDATTAQWLGDCPRRAEYAIRYNIIPKDEAVFLSAGRAIHAALATFYASGDKDLAMHELRSTFGHDADWRLPPTHRYRHLHLGHLEIVLQNYIDYAVRRDTFIPLKVKLSDLNLQNVLAAQWLVAPDDSIVLGECKLVMEFRVPTGKKGEFAPFIYAGKPDLPIKMAGSIYLLDHKSTNSYLSDYWADQYRFSNQLRGYCAMLSDMIPSMQISGAMINGIYVGAKASVSSKESKSVKFARYGPYLFQASHLNEAILNQYQWRRALDWYEAEGYYPQHASKLCSGCPYNPLCEVNPRTRPVEIQQRYQRNDYKFLELK